MFLILDNSGIIKADKIRRPAGTAGSCNWRGVCGQRCGSRRCTGHRLSATTTSAATAISRGPKEDHFDRFCTEVDIAVRGQARRRYLVRLAGLHFLESFSERKHCFAFHHDPAFFTRMAVRLRDRVWSHRAKQHSIWAGVTGVHPMRADSSVAFEAIHDDNVRGGRRARRDRLGTDVHANRHLAGVGQLEVKIRHECKSDSIRNLVGFAIDRDLPISRARIEDLTLARFCSSGSRRARIERGIADGRDCRQNCALLCRMLRIGALEFGENVAENQLAIHRARLRIAIVIDEHSDIGVFSRIDGRWVQSILTTGLLSAPATTCLLGIAEGRSSEKY